VSAWFAACACFAVSLLPGLLVAQLQPVVYGGWTELTSGGPGIQVRLGSVETAVAVLGQAGLRGVGAGIDVSWVRNRDRGEVLEPRVFLSVGVGRQFGERVAGEGWANLVAVGGTRIPYPGGGPVADLGLGVFRSLGGDNGNGYTTGLALRFVLGWAF